jgi:hypothetical protein
MCGGILTRSAGLTRREIIPRTILGATPAAGADWTIPVPGGVVWRVQSLTATLVTAVAAAIRAAAVQLFDGSVVSARIAAGATQIGSLTGNYDWFVNYGDHVAVDIVAGVTATWPDIPVPGGWTIRSATNNIQGADQWSAIVLYVLEIEETSYTVEVERELAALESRRSNPLLDLVGTDA